MSTQPGIVEVDGFTIESSRETASQMIKALSPKKGEESEPREVKPKGSEDDTVSEAASTLGKKGGEAAAKARKEAKPKTAPDKAVEAEKPAETTKAGNAEGDKDEAEEEDVYDTPELKARAAEAVRTAKRKEAELKRETARLRQENDELRRSRDARPDEARREPARSPERTQETATRKLAEKPKSADFEDYDQYLDARDQWNRSTWEAEMSQKAQERAEREEVGKTVKTFAEATKEAQNDDPDFWDKVPAIHDHTPLGQEIVRSGASAPGILLYLADDEELFDRLSKSSDLREVIREVGKIEDRLERATAGNPRSNDRPGPNPEISKARPPARPVAVSPRIASAEPGNDASFDAHADHYDAKERESRRRRSA